MFKGPGRKADAVPNVRMAVPFLWVMDMDASLHFYRDGLGFSISSQWVDGGKVRWCRLERGGAALMLQEFWREGVDANLPTSPVGQGVVLYLVCDDALALYREVTTRGVKASRPRVGNGMWVTELTDPTGYDIKFESATDAPEESEYSG
jgi:predicted enzyme related to lactoylglutathione lyase